MTKRSNGYGLGLKNMVQTAFHGKHSTLRGHLSHEVRMGVSFELRWWDSFELHRGVEDKLEKSNSISTTWLVNMVKMLISVVPPTCALSLLIFWKTVKSTLI